MPATARPLRVAGTHLIDAQGRVLCPRGFSATGSCKLPAKPDLPTHAEDIDAFFEHRNVSFVGRPFPLDEADLHLARLKNWGATFLRLIVPWEALEHTGPGQYDEPYIDYLRQLIEKMPSYDIHCIIDSHQDVWSRLCGGSGAPGWTLELAGFDLRKLHDCCAAFLHAHHLDPDEFRRGSWPTGYQKLASATMFTLFWSGDMHAPDLRIPVAEHAIGSKLFSGRDHVGIGTFLQKSHSAAYAHLARALQSCAALVGFEPMNEPHRGYVSLQSFDSFDPLTDLHYGRVPSALQSLALGEGYSARVPIYVRSFPEPTRIQSYETLTPLTNCWRSGCIWRKHRVWDWNAQKQLPVVLRRGYFQSDPKGGRHIEFYRDCWWPFLRNFARDVQAVRPDWLIFAAAIPGEDSPPWPKELQPSNLVFSPHFYDLHVLFMKYVGNFSINVQALSKGHFVLKAIHFGRQGRYMNYRRQLGNIIRNSISATNTPCFIGETGMSYDINNFHRSGSRDFVWHELGLDSILAAIEQTSPAVGFALWCYDPVNTSQWGDAWMGEDFSCISQDAYEERFRFDKNGGARCLDALQRPYAMRTAGVPVEQTFDMHTRAYSYRFRVPESEDGLSMPTSRTTDIYLPARRFDGELHVTVSDGEWSYDREAQILSWTQTDTAVPGSEHWIRIGRRGPPDRVMPPDVTISAAHWLLIVAGFGSLVAMWIAVFA